jgi:hypothetical protein
MMNTGPADTFAQLFCRKHAISPDQFETILIEQALNPRARALRRLLQLMPRDYFAPDFALIQRIGLITRPTELDPVVSEFHEHPSSRRALRRKLRVHMSLPRLRRIVANTFAECLSAA